MDNDSAQRLLMKIADGNTSDIGLTDDEDAELPPPQPVSSALSLYSVLNQCGEI